MIIDLLFFHFQFESIHNCLIKPLDESFLPYIKDICDDIEDFTYHTVWDNVSSQVSVPIERSLQKNIDNYRDS